MCVCVLENLETKTFLIQVSSQVCVPNVDVLFLSCRKKCQKSAIGSLASFLQDWWNSGEKTWETTMTSKEHLSHEKKPPTFHYTGWLIEILIMVYYNPYITG